MIYINFVILAVILIIFFIIKYLIYYNNKRETFDMYTRAGSYSADMFSSRDIPTNLCSKII